MVYIRYTADRRVVIISLVLTYAQCASLSGQNLGLTYDRGLSGLLYRAGAWFARPKEPHDALSLLPRSRPVQPWPYRELGSAAHNISSTATHAIIATVRHAPLAGVTSDMMVWWFQEGIYQHSSYPGGPNGVEWDNYLLWHPKHHIYQRVISQQHDSKLDTTAADAQQKAVDHYSSPLLWDICEFMTSSQPHGYTSSNYPGPAATAHEYFVKAQAVVKQLDSQGLWLTVPSKTGLGETFWNLKHEWRDTAAGLVVNSTQVVGVVQPTWRPVWYARLRNAIIAGLFSQGRDPRVLLEHWVTHCIEEIGNLEHILPYLHQQRHGYEVGHRRADSSNRRSTGAGDRTHTIDEL